MSSQIGEETLLLLVSCYGGLVLILCYDFIRILRRVFKTSQFRVIVEDIIFWTTASIYIFHIFLKYNYGRPRYFAIIAVLGTMCLFEWFIGRHFIDRLSIILRKILKTVLKPLKKVIEVFKLKLNCYIKRIKVWKKKEKAHRQEKEQLGD